MILEKPVKTTQASLAADADKCGILYIYIGCILFLRIFFLQFFFKELDVNQFVKKFIRKSRKYYKSLIAALFYAQDFLNYLSPFFPGAFIIYTAANKFSQNRIKGYFRNIYGFEKCQ